MRKLRMVAMLSLWVLSGALPFVVPWAAADEPENCFTASGSKCVLRCSSGTLLLMCAESSKACSGSCTDGGLGEIVSELVSSAEELDLKRQAVEAVFVEAVGDRSAKTVSEGITLILQRHDGVPLEAQAEDVDVLLRALREEYAQRRTGGL